MSNYYAAATAAPGWYNDPQHPGALRYFDGASWTEHVAPAAVAAPVGTAAAAPFPAWTPKPSQMGSDPSDPVHWLLPTGRSWQSIAAGYVALFACALWFLGPFALGLGIWGLMESHKTGVHGRGRAIFGIVVGALSTFGMLVFVVAVVSS